MKKLFIFEVLCLALSVVGIELVYPYAISCIVIRLGYSYTRTIDIIGSLIKIAHGCICLMVLTAFIAIIIEAIKAIKNKKVSE